MSSCCHIQLVGYNNANLAPNKSNACKEFEHAGNGSKYYLIKQEIIDMINREEIDENGMVPSERELAWPCLV